jgi:hypothetical protein
MIDDATPYRVSGHGPGYDGEVFARFFSRKRAEDECRDWVTPAARPSSTDQIPTCLCFAMSVAGSGSRSAQVRMVPLRGITTVQAPSVDPQR